MSIIDVAIVDALLKSVERLLKLLQERGVPDRDIEAAIWGREEKPGLEKKASRQS